MPTAIPLCGAYTDCVAEYAESRLTARTQRKAVPINHFPLLPHRWLARRPVASICGLCARRCCVFCDAVRWPSSFSRPRVHPTLGARHLAHERERVAFGVANERHPQVVVLELRDQVRLVDKLHAALSERVVRLVNVGHAIVNHGTGVVELR